MVASQIGEVLRPKENQSVKGQFACESILAGRCYGEPFPAFLVGLMAI